MPEVAWKPWIGVDLDGTLAMELPTFNPLTIGAPIPAMVEKVKKAIVDGKTVKVFTARLADAELHDKIQKLIYLWTKKHIGVALDSTNEKDPGLEAIWDDKARSVEKNEGEFKTASKIPTLYHGTSRQNLDNILKMGLKGEYRNHHSDIHNEYAHAIYLASDAHTAANYAGMHDVSQDDWIVLKIDSEKLNESSLAPDDYELPDLMDQGRVSRYYTNLYGSDWSAFPWQVSLKVCGQVAYLEDIPPTAISVNEVKTASATSTQQFKAWFQGSKVVDDKGAPLIVYHGSPEKFDTFKYGDLGFHVGTRNQAKNRQKGRDRAVIREPNESWHVMPLYASIKNPLHCEDTEWKRPREAWYSINKALNGKLDFMEREIQTELLQSPDKEEWAKGVQKGQDRPVSRKWLDILRDKLIELGYDGICYSNLYESRRNKDNSWIAFYPNQLKSAVENNGEFNSENNRLTAADNRTEKATCAWCGDKLMGDDVAEIGTAVVCPDCADAYHRGENKVASTVPPSVIQVAQKMLGEVKPEATGDSTVVDGYWIETHTLGCRNAADEPEETWWDGLYEFYDQYTNDGRSVVLGDPTDGKFVTITPQRKTASLSDGNLYHVTDTSNVTKIMKEGLKGLQTSNWMNGAGERYGNGEIYAFEDKRDALRWAARMDWEFNKKTGSGKISIIRFVRGKEMWEVDDNDPLSQFGSKGNWLKTREGISASQIIDASPFTVKEARELVEQNKQAHAQDEFLYHGTSSNALGRIAKTGVVISPSWWGTWAVAAYYAEVSAEEDDSDDEIIIRVPLSQFQTALIEPDENSIEEPLTYTLNSNEELLFNRWEASEKTWKDCLSIYGSVIYRGEVHLTPEQMSTNYMLAEHAPKTAKYVPTAFYIEVPKGARKHFWEEPPAHNNEFWAYKTRPIVLKGERIIFTMDKKPVAETVCAFVQKPGESKCDLTGKYEKHWKVYWKPSDFKKYKIASAEEPYQEIEFVCYNSKFSDSTPRDKQVQLYRALKSIDGCLPYMQDFSDDAGEQISLAAIILDPSIKQQVIEAANSLGVKIDLVNNVSHVHVDEVVLGEKEGQVAKTAYLFKDYETAEDKDLFKVLVNEQKLTVETDSKGVKSAVLSQPITLHHATREKYVDKILKNGLEPRGRYNSIYPERRLFLGTEDTCHMYVGEKGVIVLAVTVPAGTRIYDNNFEPDEVYIKNKIAPSMIKVASQIISGEAVLQYIMNLNKWSKETALEVLGIDGYGSEYTMRDFPLSRLKAGDNFSPARSEQYAKLPTPFPPIVLGYDWDWGNRRQRLVIKDGNHRVDAAKTRGDKTIKAYLPVNSKVSSKEIPWQTVWKHIRENNPHNDDGPRDAMVNIPITGQGCTWVKEIIRPNDPRIDQDPKSAYSLYPASKRDVKKYMKLYEQGSKFPAIVVQVRWNGKFVIYDGAHRLQAAVNLHVPIDAYVGYPENKTAHNKTAVGGAAAMPPSAEVRPAPATRPALEFPMRVQVTRPTKMPVIPNKGLSAGIQELVDVYAKTHGVPVDFARAVIFHESGGNPNATGIDTSSGAAAGLGQLKPALQKQYGVQDPYDPKQNLDGSMKFLRHLLTQYHDNYLLAYAAYKAGPHRVPSTTTIQEVLPTLPKESKESVQKFADLLGISILDMTKHSSFNDKFTAWFDGSKVVDKKGKPLIVWHGSPDARWLKETGVFQTLKERHGVEDPQRAFFFAGDRATAVSYADDRRAWDYQAAEPATHGFYLCLKNPLIVDNKSRKWHGTDSTVETAKAGGHDGVIIYNTIDNYQVDGHKVTDVYVAFNPEQIKAAGGNTEYDPSNKSVHASLASGGTRGAIAGAGWLTWNGVYHRINLSTPHSRAALNLGLATRDNGDSEDDINKMALLDGNIRILGNEFEAWKDDKQTRDTIADAIERTNQSVFTIEFHEREDGRGRIWEQQISRQVALEWMWSGDLPGTNKTANVQWKRRWKSQETLQVGTILYHGTSEEFEPSELESPAWFSRAKSVADRFQGWNGAPLATLEYRVTRPITLPVIFGADKREEFGEKFGINFDSAEDMRDSMLYSGLPGWVIPDNYGTGEDDILLVTLDNIEPVQDVEGKTASTPDLTLYHGTSELAWSGTEESERKLYLTKNLEDAESYAYDRAANDELDGKPATPVVLSIPLSALSGYELEPDWGFDDQLPTEAKTYQESLNEVGSIRVSGDIEALKSKFKIVKSDADLLDPNHYDELGNLKTAAKMLTLSELKKEFLWEEESSDADLQSPLSSWWLLPDGSYLGSFKMHHGAIAAYAFGLDPKEFNTVELSGKNWVNIRNFSQKFKAIRFITSGDTLDIDILFPPTTAQMRQLARMARGNKKVYWVFQGERDRFAGGMFADFQRSLDSTYKTASQWKDAKIPEEIMEKYSYGYCTRLAIALSKKLGWPIMVGYEGNEGEMYIAHAWVEAPDGRGLDISGWDGYKDFENRFTAGVRRLDWQDLAEYTGTTEPEIAEAMEVVDKYVIPAYVERGVKTATPEDLSQIDAIVKEMMPVLKAGLPVPEIKISNGQSNTLGECIWRYGYHSVTGESFCGENTTISLQRRICGDERTLRRIIAHELAHHEDSLVNEKKEFEEKGFHKFVAQRKMFRRDGHGPAWLAIAARFNAKYGKNFVTRTSDQDFVIDDSNLKPCYVLIEKYYNGNLMWQVANRLSPKAKKYLSELAAGQYLLKIHQDRYEHKLFMSSDPILIKKGAPLIQYNGWATTKNEGAQERLEELWNNGENILPQFAPAPEPKQGAKKPSFVSYDEWEGSPASMMSDDEIREAYDGFVKDFSSWKFPVIIYRAVKLTDINALRTTKVGGSWAFEENAAIAYWAEPSHPGDIYILKASCPESSVDWDTTLEMNLCGGELELTIKEGAPLTLIAYRLNTESAWTPFNKTVTASKKKYGLVMVNLPEDLVDRFEIDEADLMADGIEDEPHITVRYGIEPGDDLETVKEYLKTVRPFTIKFGETDKFDPSKSSDDAAVVIVHIESPELHKINSDLATVGKWKESDFKDYKPHMTLAYVKPGTEDKYTGLTALANEKFEVTELVISDSEENQHVIKLGLKTAGLSDEWRELDSRYKTLTSEELQRYSELAAKLENEDESDEFPNYVSGECWQYAIALVELTGFPPYIINDSEEGPVHGVVLHPSKKFLDASGLSTLQQLGKKYGLVKPFATPTKIGGLAFMCSPDDEEIKEAKKTAVKQLRKLGIPFVYAKTASPDFGYSHFNDREQDLSKVEFSMSHVTDTGFQVDATYDGKLIAWLTSHVERGKNWNYPDYTVDAVNIMDKSWRGTGLGQLLYDKAIQEAKNREADFFYSDEDLTPEAQRAWKRLKQRYPVEGLSGKATSYEIGGRNIHSTHRYRIDLNKTAATKPFPTRSFKKLWHVGTMDITKKREGSHEGNGLSVSPNPEAWQMIARSSGDYWELTKPGNLFLDFYRMSKAHRQELRTWGAEQGYIEAADTWDVCHYDDEMEDTMCSEYPTLEEALSESGYGSVEEAKEDGIEITQNTGGMLPTAKLSSRIGEPVAQAFTVDFLSMVYAEDVLKIDGVWWNETLDVSRYSAPRAVIFNTKVPTWKAVKGKIAAAQIPKQVYHGTPVAFEEYHSDADVYFFTDNAKYADWFANARNGIHNGVVQIYDLDLKKPFDARKVKNLTLDEYAQLIGANPKDLQWEVGALPSGVVVYDPSKRPFWYWFRKTQIASKQALEKQGYDGIIQKERTAIYGAEGKADSYVAFSRSQFKKIMKTAASGITREQLLAQFPGIEQDLESVDEWMGGWKEPTSPKGTLTYTFAVEPVSKFKTSIDEMVSTFSEYRKDKKRVEVITDLLKEGKPQLPIFVDASDNFIMEGRHRIVANEWAGKQTVPVVYVHPYDRSKKDASFEKEAIVSLEEGVVDKSFTFNMLENWWKKRSQFIHPSSLGNMGGYDIQVLNLNDDPFFALYDPKNRKIAGYASFIRHDHNFEVDRIAFALEYQGFSMGVKFYVWLIKNDIVPVLMAGHEQTPGGRATWEKLAKQPGIFVYGWNRKTRQAFSLDPNDLSAEEVIWSADAETNEETGERTMMPTTDEFYDMTLLAVKQ